MMNEAKRAEMLRRTGYDFDNMDDVIRILNLKIDWLRTHNKNYTKEQENKIEDIYNILDVLYNYDEEKEAYLG